MKRWTLSLRSIGTKMAVFCMAMLMIPVSAIGTIGYWVAKTETDALVEKDLRHSVHMAVQMAGLLEQSVKDGRMSREEAQEKMKQMILGPKNPDGTRPINKNIDLGENGYFFVLDTKGNLLAHPTMEGQNIWDKQSSDGVYYIRDMIEKGVNGGGFTFYEWPLPNSSTEAMKISYSAFMPEWGWVFGAGSYFQDYNRGQVRIFNSIWITLLICLVAGGVFVYVFARSLSRPIRQIAEYSAEIAKGNLSLPPLTIRRNDEIGRLSAHFNAMSRALKELVGEAMNAAESVRQSAEQLAAAMERTTASTGQIAQSVEKLSQGVENQSRSTEESARVMEEMTRGIQQIAETSSLAFETAGEMSRQSQKGDDMIRHSVRQIESVRESFQGLVDTIRNLIEYSANIEEINITLKKISGQTQLLALNASIEAAKAGEHGSGFAVVASEVRKLADQSESSSRHIAEMIEELKKAMQNVQQVLKLSESDIDNSVSVVQETGNVFRDILAASGQVLEKIEETSAALEQMTASSQEISASIQEISQIAADSSGKAAEISEAAEEQFATIHRINEWTRDLNEQVRRLQSQVQKFRV